MTNEFDLAHALHALEEHLRATLAKRSAMRLSRDLSSGAWVYGAGNYGRKIAALVKAAGHDCLGFIDQKGENLREIDGLPVLTPSSFTPTQAEGRCFVLGILNPSVEADDILPFADALPFNGRLWNADLPEALGPEANTMWLSSRSFLLENFAAIRTVSHAFADAISVETCLALVLYRITGKRGDFPAFDPRTQYLPPDLPGFDRPIVFLDGGAYTGDTCAMLTKNGVAIRSWLAFEPDSVNFRKLAETAKACGIESVLFPFGLSDCMHQVGFVCDLGAGSRVANDLSTHATIIQCVAFDNVMPQAAPDFIKLDVEGSEIAALNGMAHTIVRSTPRLAISAYHNPQDLWAIPLKLRDLLPTARLHLRQHGGNGFETVAYAIP